MHVCARCQTDQAPRLALSRLWCITILTNSQETIKNGMFLLSAFASTSVANTRASNKTLFQIEHEPRVEDLSYCTH